jgi:hypothetical protein
MPLELKKIPLSEFQMMYRYWMRSMLPDTATSDNPQDGDVIE